MSDLDEDIKRLPLDLSAILSAKTPTDPSRKVYTNRNLHLREIDTVGFDMDYTLALYHQHEMDDLSIRKTVQKLVENLGYPEEIRDVKLDHDFIIRGLVVDKEKGNVFKMDGHRHVGRCYHGYKAMSQKDIRALYGTAPIRLSTDRFARVDTLFSLPETTLMAGIIEHYEGASRTLPWSYSKLASDIRHCIDQAHADNSLKAEILGDISRFVVNDPDLGPTLHKLRSAGKRLFVLTNSEAYYTEAVMSYLLDNALPSYKSWRDYFDWIIVSGCKPAFFTKHNPFVELDAAGERVGPATELRRGVTYENGNIQDLEAFTGMSGSRVLYVGDHIYGDIVRSKKAGIWRTCLVVQEMEENFRLTHELMHQIERVNDLERAARKLDDGINYHLTLLKSLSRLQAGTAGLTGPESRVMESAAKRAKGTVNRNRELLSQTLEELAQLERSVDHRFNPYWGRVFREGNERSQLGTQVESFADIYTGRVTNLLGYSPGQYFRASRDLMPHERV